MPRPRPPEQFDVVLIEDIVVEKLSEWQALVSLGRGPAAPAVHCIEDFNVYMNCVCDSPVWVNLLCCIFV